MKFCAVFSLFIFLGIKYFECSKIVQFIFGDSLSDVGNNKNLPRSLATENLPYYGIDFGNGLPNGRFTNGRTVSDIIGDKIGLPRPVAFLDPSMNEDVILQNGGNYASRGGVILNETGGYFIQRFSLWKQIELFQATQDVIVAKIGKKEPDKFFQGARYVVALGSNDFINNYLMPFFSDSLKYNDQTFVQYLMETLESQRKVLYSLGARKLMVFGLGPMGRMIQKCYKLHEYLHGHRLYGSNSIAQSQVAGFFSNNFGSQVPQQQSYSQSGHPAHPANVVMKPVNSRQNNMNLDLNNFSQDQIQFLNRQLSACV